MNSILKFAALPAVGLYRVFFVNAPAGFRAMSEKGELVRTNLFAFLGNVSRWVYIWAQAKVQVETLHAATLQGLGFDPISLFFEAVVPRAAISLVLSVVVTAASWKWLREHFSPAHAKWVAFFLGFWAEPTVGVLGLLLKLLVTGEFPI